MRTLHGTGIEFKRFAKPSVLYVEARLPGKTFSPSRVLLPGIEPEFKVPLRMGEPNAEGKVAISIIIGRRRCGACQKADVHFGRKPRRERCGDAMPLSLESTKSLENENVHPVLSSPQGRAARMKPRSHWK